MDSSASTALQGCVSSLRTSMQLLESSINILDTGVHDYPRLSKVLQTTRVRLQTEPYETKNHSKKPI
jgi:DASH complex subunit SPC19